MEDTNCCFLKWGSSPGFLWDPSRGSKASDTSVVYKGGEEERPQLRVNTFRAQLYWCHSALELTFLRAYNNDSSARLMHQRCRCIWGSIITQCCPLLLGRDSQLLWIVSHGCNWYFTSAKTFLPLGICRIVSSLQGNQNHRPQIDLDEIVKQRRRSHLT